MTNTMIDPQQVEYYVLWSALIVHIQNYKHLVYCIFICSVVFFRLQPHAVLFVEVWNRSHFLPRRGRRHSGCHQ